MNSSRSFIHRIKRFTSSNLCKETSSIVSPQISNQLKLSQNLPSSNLQLRHIFTEEFLGSSIVKLKQERVKKELVKQNVDPANLQKQILSSIPNYQNQDLSNSDAIENQQISKEQRPAVCDDLKSNETPFANILSDDVSKMILLSKTKDQIKNAKVVVKHYVESVEPYDDAAILKKKGILFRDFMLVCRLYKVLEPARDIWDDNVFIDRVGFIDTSGKTLALNMPTVTLAYLDLLYEKKLYQDVINEVQKLQSWVTVPPYAYAVGMMACLKLNTTSSLEAAQGFYNGPTGGQLMQISRVVHPYVLLLDLQNKRSQALETMSLLSTRNFRPLRAGIMVYLLSNLKRPHEACTLLESSLRNSEREDRALAMARGQNFPKHIFSLESVKALTKAVENRNDLKLNARLAGVFSKLDKIASITEQSIIQIVTAEIDANSSLKYKRRGQENRLEENTYQEDEDSVDENFHR